MYYYGPPIYPMSWDPQPVQQVSPVYMAATKKEEDDDPYSLGAVNLDFFKSEEASNIKTDTTPVEKKPRRRTTNKPIDMDSRVDKKEDTGSEYMNSYTETQGMLRGAIAQTDKMTADINNDIDTVRASKTLKNKYGYIKDLSATNASLISTKVMAIREINNAITQAHNLTLKKDQLLKTYAADNDDMRIMDMYNAFINAPMGTYTPPGIPNIQEAIVGVNGPTADINAVSMEPSFDSANTPELNAMRHENDSNIQTVVKYDAATGRRFFDVIDVRTGASVPNIPRPHDFLLDDTTIDVRNGIAKNRNINRNWPLVQINGVVSEY